MSEPRRCTCGHREDDHRFGVYDDAEPCTWPGCDCDSFSEDVFAPAGPEEDADDEP